MLIKKMFPLFFVSPTVLKMTPYIQVLTKTA